MKRDLHTTYISHGPGIVAGHRYDAQDWSEFTYQRLSWLYGPDSALAKVTGRDLATALDLMRRNTLGQRKSAA